jgi:uncharacterized protein YecE (DUF72 family)
MDNPLFGTCSFIYPSWKDLVYSSEHPIDSLAEYAHKYKMVEIDRWFWSLGKQSAGLPNRETVFSYEKATPPDFRFTIKAPNALTLPFYPHSKEKNQYFLNPSFMESFIDSIDLISDKTQLIMLQFGYLNREMMGNQQIFIDRLETFFSALPSHIPFGIELRNNYFLNGQWFDFLRSHCITPVLLSGYWMDDIVSTIERYRDLFGPTISLRLHGEDRKQIENDSEGRWDSIVWDRERDVHSIGNTVSHLIENHQVLIAVNNHFEGSAPLTIARLQRAIKEAGER